MNRRQFLKASPLLVGPIIVPPIRSKGDSPLWICGLIVLGIGIIVTLELIKICKKAFPPPPQPPPPPPQPCDCNMPGCTCPKAVPPQAKVNAKLTDDNINYFDISNLGYVDPKTGAPVTVYFNVQLLSSYDCYLWYGKASLQGWYSQSGITLRATYYSGPGQATTVNTYLPAQGTIQFPVALGDGSEPAQFFKLI